MNVRSAEHAKAKLDASLLPSDEDVDRYEQLGWYISQQVIPHDLLDATRVAIEEHHLGRRDRKLSGAANFSDWKTGDGDGVRNNEFCSLQNDGVKALVTLPVVGAIAAKLARSSVIRLFDDQAIYKPPAPDARSSSAVGWHTDHSYWSTCTSDRMLTAWIPLHDAEIRNGTLYVISGSHLWPESEHLRGFNNPDLDSIETRMGRKIAAEVIAPMILAKGQVSFHHMRAIHASAPNLAVTPRIAVAVHMQDGNNQHRRHLTPAGIEVVLPHEMLCRKRENGTPDFADPDVFTQLWPPVLA